MTEYNGIEFLDFLLFLAKQKKKILVAFFASLFFSYLFLFFLVDEQFEANAVIIPRGESSGAGLNMILKNFNKGIPTSLGTSTSSQDEINRYNTIVFSRSTLEGIINKYNLLKVYRIDSTEEDAMETALRRLRKKITTRETNNDAYEIIAKSNSPKLSADIANSLVESLNEKVINLEISKSKENRVFLEKRVEEIKIELRRSEDSLKLFQESSGLIDVKNQMQGLITVYSELESELITKQLQKSVLEKLYNKNHPEVKSVEIQISEYQKKLNKIKSEDEPGNIVLAMKNIPEKTAEYLRRFRSVEINNSLLEFIIPLYEQAKIEEKKDFPILQIIDFAIPPKNSTIPRILFALGLSLFVTTFLILYLFVSQLLINSTNPKLESLKNELRFKRKK